MENVFAWKKFDVDFHVEGVSVDPNKKYFAIPETKRRLIRSRPCDG